MLASRNTFSRAAVVLAFAAVASLSTSAGAQALGQKGDVSFAADRLMGIYIYDEGPSVTAIGLGALPSDGWYRTTRLGIDFFVIDHLSLGGTFAYFSYDPDGRRGNYDGFLFTARVGWTIDFNDSFGFWPRGGLTFRDVESDDEMALTLEGMFWAAPASHFAFTFGPAIDLGIAGDGQEEQNFGLITAGILGWI